MCGIAGVVLPEPAAQWASLEAMRDSLSHRGPDDAGTWWSTDRRVGLAHRRLSIIDLSPNGHQPMLDTAGEFVLSFNGEIYNYQQLRAELEQLGHRFRTATDSEVILEAYRAWGPHCLTHFNGMFAFALYDTGKRELFIARDRAGEKPLFYSHHAGRFLFASELKALMAVPDYPRELNLTALQFYLAYGYVPGDLCILQHAAKLPQGHALCYNIETQALRTWRYWDLPNPSTEPVDVEDLTEELEKLLLESVRLRLIADVPVGILLSGGIDSSLVTALAAKVSPSKVRTFTVSFPGAGMYDESAHARKVADFFATEHVELLAEPGNVDLLGALAVQFDEPLADSSLLPTFLVSRLIRQHATVALGGDGGDELFGGYPYYSQLQRQQWIGHLVPRVARAGLRSAAAHLLPTGFRGRNYLMGLAADTRQAIADNGVYFDQLTRAQLLNGNGQREGAADPIRWKMQLSDENNSAIRRATETDFRSYLVDDVLVKVDRASMLTSLEVRAPWLDAAIIEFAFGRVPDWLRATRSDRKIVPRLLATKVLPPNLDLKRKQGFSLPLQTWFKGGWGDFFRDVLLPSDSGFFDPNVIARMIAGQGNAYNNTHRLFALTMFELWRRHYRISTGALQIAAYA